MKNIVIFDLDGTLALIDDRRKISTKPNGKMDWDKFFDPKNINLDRVLSNIPNIPHKDVPNGIDENDNVEIINAVGGG